MKYTQQQRVEESEIGVEDIKDEKRRKSSDIYKEFSEKNLKAKLKELKELDEQMGKFGEIVKKQAAIIKNNDKIIENQNKLSKNLDVEIKNKQKIIRELDYNIEANKIRLEEYMKAVQRYKRFLVYISDDYM